MELDYISLTPEEVRKLLSAGSGDAALAYLYARATGDLTLRHAREHIPMDAQTLGWAESLLKQLGLLEVKAPAPRYDRAAAPTYTGEAVTAYAARDPSFALLQGEFSRRLGRVLTTEELKTLLSLRDYLGLPSEVVSMVLTYCLQRNEYYNRIHGTGRTVTLRAVERECYAWANKGVVTLEQASGYLSKKLAAMAPEAQTKKTLQLDRPLADGERTYIQTWLGWGFDQEAIRMAYEKTLLATGKLAWRYMNKVLQNWHEKGLHAPEEIQAGDRRAPAPAQEGYTLGQSELQAISRLERLRDAVKEE